MLLRNGILKRLRRAYSRVEFPGGEDDEVFDGVVGGSFDEPGVAAGDNSSETNSTTPTGEEKAPTFKPRFASWEEAERHAAEMEQRFTTVAVSSASPRSGQPERAEAPTTRASVAITKAALTQIKALDPTAVDREEQAAVIWADAQEKIADDRVRVVREQERSEGVQRQTVDAYVDSVLATEGLDTPELKQAFWVMAQNTPKKPGQTFADQVQTVVAGVKDFVAKVGGTIKKREAEEGRVRRDTTVLGKGARGSRAGDTNRDDGPVTLADAIKQSKQARRVTAATLGGQQR